MNRVLHTLVALLGGALGSLSSVAAQVPQGYYVFGTFGSAGQKGLFLVHPRAPATPITVTGLSGDLLSSGSSCVLYRPFDGAIVCAERVQPNSSVDVHVIELNGTHVLRDASFSVGTGGSCCGEIPQMGLLADGRIVRSGDKSLALELEARGYAWLEDEVA